MNKRANSSVKQNNASICVTNHLQLVKSHTTANTEYQANILVLPDPNLKNKQIDLANTLKKNSGIGYTTSAKNANSKKIQISQTPNEGQELVMMVKKRQTNTKNMFGNDNTRFKAKNPLKQRSVAHILSEGNTSP